MQSRRKRDADRIDLVEGHAVHMGQGMFMLFQESEHGTESVLIQPADIEALVAASPASVYMNDLRPAAVVTRPKRGIRRDPRSTVAG